MLTQDQRALLPSLQEVFQGTKSLAQLELIEPDATKNIIGQAYNQVFAHTPLQDRDLALATIAGLSALGGTHPLFASSIQAALKLGLTKSEIAETITNVALISGFSAAITAAQEARAVFDSFESDDSEMAP